VQAYREQRAIAVAAYGADPCRRLTSAEGQMLGIATGVWSFLDSWGVINYGATDRLLLPPPGVHVKPRLVMPLGYLAFGSDLLRDCSCESRVSIYVLQVICRDTFLQWQCSHAYIYACTHLTKICEMCPISAYGVHCSERALTSQPITPYGNLKTLQVFSAHACVHAFVHRLLNRPQASHWGQVSAVRQWV
jgi:hypothetical protein